MQARIYRPAKSAMQSGTKAQSWILEYPANNGHTKDELMGWNSSSNTLTELKLKFISQEEAIKYANANNISYELLPYKERTALKKQYSDNFVR